MKLIAYEELRPVKGIRYSKSQLWRLEKKGIFPKRVPVGPARYAYVDQEIDAWIEQRAADRADPNQLTLLAETLSEQG
jgi:prophage regulatory protein